jgi:hypothetical protein
MLLLPAFSRSASASLTSKPSRPSCRQSPLFLRRFNFMAASSRSALELHPCSAAPVAGGMPSTDRECIDSPKSLFNRPLLFFFKTSLMRLPPLGTPAVPRGLGWVLRALARVAHHRGSPPPQPRRAQEGILCLDGCGALRPFRDHREVRRRTRRREHPEPPRVRLPRRFVGGCRWCADRAAPRPAGSQRCTMRRTTATPNPPCGCSSAAPTRPSPAPTGALCLSQPSDGRTPNRPARRRETPRQYAKAFSKLFEYDVAVLEVRPPTSRALYLCCVLCTLRTPRMHCRNTARWSWAYGEAPAA